jgi:hypothetical protein
MPIRSRSLRSAGLILLTLLWSTSALAHVTSTGVAVLAVKGPRLEYRLALARSDVDELFLPILQAAIDGQIAAARRVTAALRGYARFSVAGGACTPTQDAIRNEGADKIVLEMVLACPKSSGTLWIRDDWPEVLGAHFQTIMTVTVAGNMAGQFVFLDERRDATLQLDVPPDFGWLSFIRLGAEHILSGPDHLLFLLALLALVRGLWPTVKIVTGFTVAHSIALSLAVLGLVDVPSRIVEPLIAASIVWVAVENLAASTGTGRRWLVAAVFGLVHGLGFSSGLQELGLPREALVRALVGFNLGVEAGQIAFVAVVLPPLAWLSRPYRWPGLPKVLSIGVAVMGGVWLVERVFFSR